MADGEGETLESKLKNALVLETLKKEELSLLLRSANGKKIMEVKEIDKKLRTCIRSQFTVAERIYEGKKFPITHLQVNANRSDRHESIPEFVYESSPNFMAWIIMKRNKRKDAEKLEKDFFDANIYMPDPDLSKRTAPTTRSKAKQIQDYVFQKMGYTPLKGSNPAPPKKKEHDGGIIKVKDQPEFDNINEQGVIKEQVAKATLVAVSPSDPPCSPDEDSSPVSSTSIQDLEDVSSSDCSIEKSEDYIDLPPTPKGILKNSTVTLEYLFDAPVAGPSCQRGQTCVTPEQFRKELQVKETPKYFRFKKGTKEEDDESDENS